MSPYSRTLSSCWVRQFQMDAYNPHLKRISDKAKDLTGLLAQWVRINSQTYNRSGLDQMITLLEGSFSPLGGQMESLEVGTLNAMGPRGKEVERQLGQALRILKRPEAPLRILMCGHMDTVLEPINVSMGKERPADGKMWETGAADAKGGLAVMLAALECLEESPFAKEIGWEILIVPDEEVGSHNSKPLLLEAAKRCHLGLVFEPALHDGALVGERVGSGNFVVSVHGRSAHAGREPEAGRNAIDALADFIVSLRRLRTKGRKIRVNVGAIEGGGPVNVVPDFALCRVNIRVPTSADLETAEKSIARIAAEVEQVEGISVEVKGRFGRPPKTLDPQTLHMLEHLAACGRDLGMTLGWRSSGGVCDGNTLSWAGLPNVDSLGPVGGGMHTPEEYVIEASVIERARLVALFLMIISRKEIPWPPPGKG